MSHVPHVTAAALVDLAKTHAGAGDELLRLAAGGFKDTTRIAAGSAELWTGICLDNADALSGGIEELRRVLGEFERMVRERDAEGVRAWLEHAAEVRTVAAHEVGAGHSGADRAARADPRPSGRRQRGHRGGQPRRVQHREHRDRPPVRGQRRARAGADRRGRHGRGRDRPARTAATIPACSRSAAKLGRRRSGVRGARRISARSAAPSASRGQVALAQGSPLRRAGRGHLAPHGRARQRRRARDDRGGPRARSPSDRVLARASADSTSRFAGGERPARRAPDGPIDCGNSGTTARMLSGCARRLADLGHAHGRRVAVAGARWGA